MQIGANTQNLNNRNMFGLSSIEIMGMTFTPQEYIIAIIVALFLEKKGYILVALYVALKFYGSRQIQQQTQRRR